jgi:hypothetical protein
LLQRGSWISVQYVAATLDALVTETLLGARMEGEQTPMKELSSREDPAARPQTSKKQQRQNKVNKPSGA